MRSQNGDIIKLVSYHYLSITFSIFIQIHNLNEWGHLKNSTQIIDICEPMSPHVIHSSLFMNPFPNLVTSQRWKQFCYLDEQLQQNVNKLVITGLINWSHLWNNSFWREWHLALPSMPDPRSCMGSLLALGPVHDKQTTSWHTILSNG